MKSDKKENLKLCLFRSKSVYKINQMVVSCQVKLLKADGAKIENNKEAGISHIFFDDFPSINNILNSLSAIANDFLNSLWQKSQICLNNVPVNSSSSYHYLKSGLLT